MSYKVGDIVEGEMVAKVGKLYWVWGWAKEGVEFDDFHTHNLAEAKKCAKRANKTGSVQIKEYECCFNQYGEMIQRLDDETAVFDGVNGMTRQVI